MSYKNAQNPTDVPDSSSAAALSDAVDLVLDQDLILSRQGQNLSVSPPSALPCPEGPEMPPLDLEGVHVAPGVLLRKPRLPAVRLDAAQYLTFPEECATPFTLLAREVTHQCPTISRDTYHQLSLYRSFKPVELGSLLSYDAGCFVSLAHAIIKEDGNVHKFALDTQATHYDWLRISATKFVRLLLHPETSLPTFVDNSLSYFDGSLNGISSSEFPSEFPSGLLSLDALYRVFFLDRALPYYVYLYAMDIRGERAMLKADELAFISTFDYYTFVAAITYLGSLLLMAAEGFSRILYEGVRWMLLRAYCNLGILEWTIVKAHLSKDNPDYSRIVFSGMLSPSERFNSKDTTCDSYAQYGWESFRRTSNAPFYLASITQIAFFNSHRYESSDRLFDLQDRCLSGGYVPYKSTTLKRKISEEHYRKKDLKRFCTYALEEEECIFCRIPITEDNTLDIAHELYFLFELLGINKQDFGGTKYLPYFLQKTKLEEVRSSNPTSNLIPSSLCFPLPPNFGINRFKSEPIYRFDFARYLQVRYSITFNPFILDTIPRLIYRSIFDEQANTLTPIAQLRDEYSKLNVLYEDSLANKKYDISKGASDEAARKLMQGEAKIELSDLENKIKESLLELFSTILANQLDLESYRTSKLNKEDLISLITSSNSLKSWEIYLSLEDLTQMSTVIHSSYSNPSPKAIIAKTKALSIVVPDSISDTVYLPRPNVNHPDAMFFALKVPPVSAETMIVTSFKNILYAGFSGVLQGIISRTIENDELTKPKTRTYKVYPYTFVPLATLCGNRGLMQSLGEYIDMPTIIDIYQNLQLEYPQTDIFALACRMGITPYWMEQHLGSTNAKHYFELSSRIRMNPIVMEQLASIYSIPIPDHIPTLTVADYDRIRNSGRVLNYVPRFTDINDQYIRKLFSPDMTKADKKCLLDNCKGHTWKSIEARARVISKKMLEEERVFNINILPVRNYTAKTRELLERNFNAALNVDPRLKVDDTKKTEAALRKKYLTPRPRRPL